jgi:Flp pilus assembly protein TadG
MFKSRRRNRTLRRAATAVEVAMVLPMFLLLLLGLFEFGHAYMTTELLKAAATAAARRGVADGRTTTDVLEKASEVLSAGFDASKATVFVKDASLFDSPSVTLPSSWVDLDDAEVSELDPRSLFVVRIEVPYNDIALLPTGWLTSGITLSGQAVMRHE